ncbi:hypothetical protein OF83DRAFT_1132067 [Amylostereum chailletii]|nr:hypothetical protein OF83DRAFT_1132067 [Amylostereum chailletii]
MSESSMSFEQRYHAELRRRQKLEEKVRVMKQQVEEAMKKRRRFQVATENTKKEKIKVKGRLMHEIALRKQREDWERAPLEAPDWVSYPTNREVFLAEKSLRALLMHLGEGSEIPRSLKLKGLIDRVAWRIEQVHCGMESEISAVTETTCYELRDILDNVEEEPAASALEQLLSRLEKRESDYGLDY